MTGDKPARAAANTLCLALALCFTAALTANALTLDVPCLPAPTFADREVSGDAGIPANARDNLRRLSLELAFSATPSNNVQVAFGRDAEPLDGKLAAEETAFIVGWDSGEWFLRPEGLKARHAIAPSDNRTSRRRKLSATIRGNTSGAPTAVEFSDDTGAFEFKGLALDPPPAWLTPSNWDLLRVTVRGTDVAGEDIRVRFSPDGAMIILRWHHGVSANTSSFVHNRHLPAGRRRGALLPGRLAAHLA